MTQRLLTLLVLPAAAGLFAMMGSNHWIGGSVAVGMYSIGLGLAEIADKMPQK